MTKRKVADKADAGDEPPFCRAEVERQLLEKIVAWARFHERCPLGGCRRNARCLRDDDCRAVSSEPLSDERRLQIGRHVRAALARFSQPEGA